MATPEDKTAWESIVESRKEIVDYLGDTPKRVNRFFGDVVGAVAGEEEGEKLYERLRQSDLETTDAFIEVYGQDRLNEDEKISEVVTTLIDTGSPTAAYKKYKEVTKSIDEENADLIDENINEIRENSQMLLTLNYDFFKKFYSNRIGVGPLKNFGIIIGDPTKIMNQFIQPKQFKEFLNIKPITLAKMIPTVRLFKTEYDERGVETNNFEIRFDEFFQDPASILENKLSRGGGVGLKSFDWSYTGTNPFESTKVIKASLKLRLSSAEDLDKEYILTSVSGETTRFKLVDLIAPSVNTGGEDEFNPNFLTFKAVVGYSPNFTAETKEESKIKKQLEVLRRTLCLTRTKHDIEFRQNGTIMLTLDFQARIDTALQTPQNDVLGVFGTNIRKIEGAIEDIRADLNRLKDSCGEKEKTEYETLKSIFDKRVQNLESRKALTYKRLLDVMMSQNRVYTVDVPLSSVGLVKDSNGSYKVIKQSKLGEFIKQITGDFSSGKIAQPRQYSGPVRRRVSAGGKNPKEAGENLKKELNNQIRQCIISGGVDTMEVPFMFFGDLVEAALIPFSLEENPFNKDMRVFLGTGIRKKNKSDNNPVSFPLTHVPISLDLFMDWFIDTVYTKQKTTFFLKDFLVSMSTSLLSESLKLEDLASDEAPIFSRNIITTLLDLPKEIANKPVIDLEKETINMHSAAMLKNNTSCYLIATRDTFEVASREEVPNLSLGLDCGLVKNIDYKRAEQPFLREIAMNNSESDTFSILSEPYTATVKMIGNNLFYPGQTIYLDPSTAFPGGDIRGSGRNSLKIRGIFFINKVDNFISDGKFETVIDTRWIGWGNGKGNPLVAGNAKQANACDPIKLSDSIRSKFLSLGKDVEVDDAGLVTETPKIGVRMGGYTGRGAMVDEVPEPSTGVGPGQRQKK